MEHAWPRRPPGGPIMLLAHRGGTGPWRENTLEAFAGALGGGADGVELDVRRSGDGELVVHHDPDIPGVGAVGALARRELPSWLPTLEAALAACAGAVVNVEVKSSPVESGHDPGESVAAQVVASVESRPAAAGGPSHVIVSSFWPASLAAVRAASPTVATGLLVHPSLDVSAAVHQAKGLGCVAVHPFHRQVTAELVTAVHALDMAVVTWTPNERSDLVAVAEAGVDAVISDRVAEARDVLGNR